MLLGAALVIGAAVLATIAGQAWFVAVLAVSFAPLVMAYRRPAMPRPMGRHRAADRR
jgi:hypothetical protein